MISGGKFDTSICEGNSAGGGKLSTETDVTGGGKFATLTSPETACTSGNSMLTSPSSSPETSTGTRNPSDVRGSGEMISNGSPSGSTARAPNTSVGFV